MCLQNLKEASQVALVEKNPPTNAGDIREVGSIPGSRRFPGGGNGNPLKYSCLGKSHGQRNLACCSPWGRKELDVTEAFGKQNLNIPQDWLEKGRLWEGLPWWLSAEAAPAVQETQLPSLGREDPLEEGIATRSSVLAWRIPWTQETGRLYSKESDTAERLTISLFTFTGCSQRVFVSPDSESGLQTDDNLSFSLRGNNSEIFQVSEPRFSIWLTFEQRCSFSWGDFSDFAEEAQIRISSSVTAIIQTCEKASWTPLFPWLMFISRLFHALSGLPDTSVGKESTCNAGDPVLIPGSGRAPGEGKGYPFQYSWAPLVDQLVKNLPAMQKTWVSSPGWEDTLEKRKTTHSNTLA